MSSDCFYGEELVSSRIRRFLSIHNRQGTWLRIGRKLMFASATTVGLAGTFAIGSASPVGAIPDDGNRGFSETDSNSSSFGGNDNDSFTNETDDLDAFGGSGNDTVTDSANTDDSTNGPIETSFDSDTAPWSWSGLSDANEDFQPNEPSVAMPEAAADPFDSITAESLGLVDQPTFSLQVAQVGDSVDSFKNAVGDQEAETEDDQPDDQLNNTEATDATGTNFYLGAAKGGQAYTDAIREATRNATPDELQVDIDSAISKIDPAEYRPANSIAVTNLTRQAGDSTDFQASQADLYKATQLATTEQEREQIAEAAETLENRRSATIDDLISQAETAASDDDFATATDLVQEANRVANEVVDHQMLDGFRNDDAHAEAIEAVETSIALEQLDAYLKGIDDNLPDDNNQATSENNAQALTGFDDFTGISVNDNVKFNGHSVSIETRYIDGLATETTYVDELTGTRHPASAKARLEIARLPGPSSATADMPTDDASSQERRDVPAALDAATEAIELIELSREALAQDDPDLASRLLNEAQATRESVLPTYTPNAHSDLEQVDEQYSKARRDLRAELEIQTTGRRIDIAGNPVPARGAQREFYQTPDGDWMPVELSPESITEVQSPEYESPQPAREPEARKSDASESSPETVLTASPESVHGPAGGETDNSRDTSDLFSFLQSWLRDNATSRGSR